MLRQLPSRYATEGKPSHYSIEGAYTAADPGLAGKIRKEKPLNVVQWVLGALKL